LLVTILKYIPPPIATSHWNGAIVQQVSSLAVYAQVRQAPLPV